MPDAEIPAPCPGCGCEPEVFRYLRRGGEIVGYVDTCGARVVDAALVGFSPR